MPRKRKARKILVSGLINIETTLKIEGFPLEYSPVRYPFGGIASSVSGVGLNVALALSGLGDRVSLLSILGKDLEAEIALGSLSQKGLETQGILRDMPETARSVILYESSGRRQINVDLKDLQERRYPKEKFAEAIGDSAAAILCNINWNRDLLSEAKSRGLTVISDVHTLSDPLDAYNCDFMAAADLLFLSDERLWTSPAEAARELLSLYGMRLVIVGMGAHGALLAERGLPAVEVPAVTTRPLVSTIGSGDALLSAFSHFWLGDGKAEEALRRAVTFASWKIGEVRASAGFLDEEELMTLHDSTPSPSHRTLPQG
ncbi:MAG: carbohydrate kinase family protein [Spirochaetota bacterium]